MKCFRSLRAVSAGWWLLLLPVGAGVAPGAEDRFANLSKPVADFKLANGVHFLVVERPQAPVVSFHLRIRAGYADEPSGKGGVAHLALRTFLEGSETLGSKNPVAEKAAMSEAAKFLDAYRSEDAKGEKADDVIKGRLEGQMNDALTRAAMNAHSFHFFENVLLQNGVAEPLLRPSADFSDIALTLPSHRAELWFRMMGGWLQAPSLRFFYQSRAQFADQRVALAKSPGSQQRQFALSSAFLAHPYQAMRTVDTELKLVFEQDVRDFLAKHYVPGNITIAIVGDIAAADARRLAEANFGKIGGQAPQPVRQVAMAKLAGNERLRLAVPEAPAFAVGWARPEGTHADDAALDMLQAVVSGGPGSRVHSELQAGTPIVSRLTAMARFPGSRFPGLFVIEAEPLPARSLDEVENGVIKAVNAMATETVTPEELERARMWWRSRFLEEARSASGRAGQLVRAQTEYGDFRIEARLAKLDAVSAADCQRVLTEYIAARPHLVVEQLSLVDGAEAAQ